MKILINKPCIKRYEFKHILHNNTTRILDKHAKTKNFFLLIFLYINIPYITPDIIATSERENNMHIRIIK